MRNAVASYERAIEREPGFDKAHWQLIGACTGLREPERAQSRYRRSRAASPQEVREHRYLAAALLAPLMRSTAQDLAEAEAVLAAGLNLVPDDPMLIELRGDLRAASGDPENALADWRHALELDPDNISAAYSTAFLWERRGRLDAAVEAWRLIVSWCEERDGGLSAEWPRRELERLQRGLAGGAL